MNREEIKNIIMPLVEKNTWTWVDGEPKSATEESHFHNDLGYDSIDSVEFIMDIEKAFNLSIPDEEMEKFRTARDVIDWVYKEINK